MAALKPLATDKLILGRLFSASLENEVLTWGQEVGGEVFPSDSVGWQPLGPLPAWPRVLCALKSVSALDPGPVSVFLSQLCEFIVP